MFVEELAEELACFGDLLLRAAHRVVHVLRLGRPGLEPAKVMPFGEAFDGGVNLGCRPELLDSLVEPLLGHRQLSVVPCGEHSIVRQDGSWVRDSRRSGKRVEGIVGQQRDLTRLMRFSSSVDAPHPACGDCCTVR